MFSLFLLQISIEIRPIGLMAPWVYDEKFAMDMQFLFRTLMFTVGEDGNLELQVRCPPPRQWASIYDGAPYYLAGPSSTTTSASDRLRSGLNPCAGMYTLATMTP
jgi:hypothetical protein